MSARLPLGDFVVDLEAGCVLRADEVVRLTATEVALLGLLAKRAGEPVSREELLQQVWGYPGEVRSRTVDTTVRRLRQKIERDPVHPRHLLTVYGVGYTLALPAAVPEAPEAPEVFVSLGSFDLEELIGRGGSAEVWGARHRRSGTPVAVKVLTENKAGVTALRRAFLRESRAVAGLDHPHIVRLLDLGEVDERAARATGFLPGAPWLAMELARESLSSLRGRLAWPALREVLLQTLDALAHAHARGVMHLDVKPDNLLVGCGGADGGPAAGFRLSDFGIARAFSDRGRGVGGTPHYMAPEQIRRAWRELGPWTDLFGVGATAWALASGRPPFEAASGRAVLARGWKPPPPLKPAVAVPEGFEAWLRRLLERDIHQRFSRAAAAARALEALGVPVGGGGAPALQEELPTLQRSDLPTELFSDVVMDEEVGPSPGVTRTLPAEVSVPELSGGRRAPPPAPIQLADAGLALLPLRTTPFVGRERERDRLWGRLLQVREEGRPAVAEITGRSGLGLTRLARWLAERAHEVGLARVLHCGPEDEGRGLAPSLEAWLSCDGLDDDAALERTRRFLARRGARQQELPGLVLAALRGRAGRDGARILAELLAICGHSRTVLVVVDDAHRSPEALSAALNLTEADRADGAGRVLVVLVVPEDEVLLGRALSRLQALRGRPGHLALALAPLDHSEILALLARSLALRADLAAQIAARADGDPGVALQILADLAGRGLLEVTPGGFGLRRVGEVEAPEIVEVDSARAVWLARAEAAERAAGCGPEPLELAAALGRTFGGGDWRALAERAAGKAALEPLLESGLLQALGGQLALVSGALREALRQRAIDAGRWSAHNRVCARLLEARGDALAAVPHLRAAGRGERALEVLLEEGGGRLEQGALPRTWSALERADQVAAELALAAGDPMRGRLELLRLRALDAQGSRKAVHDAALALSESARAHGWPGVRGEALRLAGRALLMHPDAALGEARLGEALAAFEASGDRRRALAARASLAQHLAYRGQAARGVAVAEQALAEALALGDLEGQIRGEMTLSLALQLDRRGEESLRRARRALALAERSGRPLWARRCRERLVDALLDAGLREEGRAQVEWCLEAARRDGALSDVGKLLNTLGDLHRADGDAASAGRCYRQATELADLAEGNHPWFARLNLALLMLAEGRAQEAAQLSAEATAAAERRRYPPLEAAALTVRCAALAQLGQWREYDAYAERARELDARLRLRQADLARCWERSAEACEGAGQLERARAAWEDAVAVWRRVGDRAAATAARARLVALLEG